MNQRDAQLTQFVLAQRGRAGLEVEQRVDQRAGRRRWRGQRERFPERQLGGSGEAQRLVKVRRLRSVVRGERVGNEQEKEKDKEKNCFFKREKK